MPEPIIVTGGPLKLEPPPVVAPASPAGGSPPGPGFGGRVLGLAARLVRGVISLLFVVLRVLLKGLGAAISRYPRHSLAAALSLVMLAAIAYTQNRDAAKPPLNQVQAGKPKDPSQDPSLVRRETHPAPAHPESAAADAQVGAVSHTTTTDPALPAPTATDVSVTHAPIPDAPIEPAPTAPPEPPPSLAVAAALPPPLSPESKHEATETFPVPPPITPAQRLPDGDLAPLPPVENDATLLALAPTPDQKPGDPKSPMPDLPPAAPIEASPNPQPLPISSSTEPGPLFSASETKPEEPAKKPELPEPSKVAESLTPTSDPPKAAPKPELAKSEPTKSESPKPELAKSEPPKAAPKPETKGLEPPVPVALPEPTKAPLPDPKPVVAAQKPQPPPVIEKPEPAAPAHPEPAITARPPEEPRPAQPNMAAAASTRSGGGLSDPALAGWKEIPNLGKVPLESGEDTDAAAEPGEQAAGVAAAGARDPRAHVARDVSFELEASDARHAVSARSKTREPARLASAEEKIEATLHVVERKENFWTISRLYYGSGRYYKALWKANAEKCPRIDGLRVGDVLVIPAPEDLDSSLFERLTSNVRKTAARTDDDPNPPPRKPRPRADDELVLPPARGTPVSRRDRGFEEREDPGSDPDDDATTHASARPRDSSAAPDRPRRAVYKVRASDTLRSIARDTLGSSRRAGEIIDLNPGLVDESGRLTAGQLIELPDDARVSVRR